ncbi:D-amino acid aminotransferase [Sterolibacterium denitrificans]|nr:D-amino acid aminotransferase [Sterolibacterium denitrificans]
MTSIPTIYLNGEFMPLAEARVPVMDRGFLFGDGVYEVIPVYSRRPFRLDEHLGRLQRSLDGIRLANPLRGDAWTALIAQIIAANEGEDQQIYLQVTRGADGKRNHAFPKEIQPTVFVMSEPLLPPPAAQRAQGIAAISAADNRWHRCDIKATSLLANCLLRQRAIDAGCAETLLLRDGFLTEGAASNIFVVKNDVILAPPKNHLMLPGVTYDVILELAARHGLPHQARDVLEEEVRTADELWLTSSTKEVLPIVRLDDKPVGGGRPGPLYAQMLAWYQDYKRAVMRSHVDA